MRVGSSRAGLLISSLHLVYVSVLNFLYSQVTRHLSYVSKATYLVLTIQTLNTGCRRMFLQCHAMPCLRHMLGCSKPASNHYFPCRACLHKLRYFTMIFRDICSCALAADREASQIFLEGPKKLLHELEEKYVIARIGA
jgi:hypothetical protein